MNSQNFKTPQAVQACHELILWIIPQLDKFPRARRFKLGSQIENGLLKVLENIIEAAYSQQKRSPLQQANRQLEINRHLWRLAYELQVISIKSYEHGIKLMNDLGKQVGGWLNSCQNV